MTDGPEILREYRVKIVPAGVFEPVGNNDLGRRTKFGGVPNEIQGGQSGITCPSYRKKMSFVGQIDSFEFDGKDHPNRRDAFDTQFMFGDVGLIYEWFCFDCCEPLATKECY